MIDLASGRILTEVRFRHALFCDSTHGRMTDIVEGRQSSSGGNPANHLFLPKNSLQDCLVHPWFYQEKAEEDCRFSDNLGLRPDLSFDLGSANGPVFSLTIGSRCRKAVLKPFRDHGPFGMAYMCPERS